MNRSLETKTLFLCLLVFYYLRLYPIFSESVCVCVYIYTKYISFSHQTKSSKTTSQVLNYSQTTVTLEKVLMS